MNYCILICETFYLAILVRPKSYYINCGSDDVTPTPSISLDSTPLASGASSLAATPTHTPLPPFQNI